jgi:phosphorylcholine metabolism protein LicD
MHTFYINVPSDYKYDWSISSSPAVVLSIEHGAYIEFICNSWAKISEGDVYKVKVNSVKDELFFLLKTGFKKIKTEVVNEYLKYPYKPYGNNLTVEV